VLLEEPSWSRKWGNGFGGGENFLDWYRQTLPDYPYAEVPTVNFMYLRLYGYDRLYVNDKELRELLSIPNRWFVIN